MSDSSNHSESPRQKDVDQPSGSSASTWSALASAPTRAAACAEPSSSVTTSSSPCGSRDGDFTAHSADGGVTSAVSVGDRSENGRHCTDVSAEGASSLAPGPSADSGQVSGDGGQVTGDAGSRGDSRGDPEPLSEGTFTEPRPSSDHGEIQSSTGRDSSVIRGGGVPEEARMVSRKSPGKTLRI